MVKKLPANAGDMGLVLDPGGSHRPAGAIKPGGHSH